MNGGGAPLRSARQRLCKGLVKLIAFAKSAPFLAPLGPRGLRTPPRSAATMRQRYCGSAASATLEPSVQKARMRKALLQPVAPAPYRAEAGRGDIYAKFLPV